MGSRGRFTIRKSALVDRNLARSAHGTECEGWILNPGCFQSGMTKRRCRSFTPDTSAVKADPHGIGDTTQTKNPGRNSDRGFSFNSLAVSYFHTANAALSSALSGFTSEFGMVSGGSHLLWPPGKLVGRKGDGVIFATRVLKIPGAWSQRKPLRPLFSANSAC